MEGLDQPTAAVVHNNTAAAGLAAGVVSKKAAADTLRRLEGLFERSGGHLTAALEVRWLLTTPVQSSKTIRGHRFDTANAVSPL